MEKNRNDLIGQMFKEIKDLDEDEQKAILEIMEKSARCFIRDDAIEGKQPIVIYGSNQCPDCIECLKSMNEKGVTYEFRDITEKLQYLKEYIEMRDYSPSFIRIKNDGKLGIPCICITDGVQIFGWETFLADERPKDENDMLLQLEKLMKVNDINAKGKEN